MISQPMRLALDIGGSPAPERGADFRCLSEERSYQHIYLSPHADDAALSCGGRIYDQRRRGERVLVLGFFVHSPPAMALSPFAQGQHDKWELTGDPMDHRRAEDMAALRSLGAEVSYLKYLDCIYRRHPLTGEAMYASEEEIFGVIDEAESAFHRDLAARIVEIVGPPRPDLTLYAPLAVGHHVDHQLLHRAVVELVVQGYAASFYEDYPYAQKPGMLQAALADWRGPGTLRPEPYLLDEAAMNARVAAIGEYVSQIRTLFGDHEAMREQAWSYCAAVAAQSGQAGCAERYWVPR